MIPFSPSAAPATVGDPAVPSRFWNRRRRALWSIYLLAALIVAGWSGLTDWRDRHAFLINVTQSLPNWAFLIERGVTPKVGDYVFFDPPLSSVLVRHFGPKPQMFGKIVYGRGGDLVTRVGRTFFVNGRQVAIAKPASRLGEPLAVGPVGRLPSGCYYVGSPHKDGFDSRYALIGWVCTNRIIGVGTPIL